MKNLFMKYSPKQLDEIIDQPLIVKELKQRAIDNNFSQNIFFSGNTGTGKTTLGRIVAKYLLCESPKDKSPCDSCETCISINEQKSLMSFRELNGSNLGKDQVVELVNSSVRRTALSANKNRVIFITEAQLIKSDVAEKNLLVALQNSVPNLYWIFDSMDYSSISKALLHRFTFYNLKPISSEGIATCLLRVCKEEGHDITPTKALVLKAVSDHSHGDMRYALSILERVLYSNLWDIETLTTELGIVPLTDIYSIFKSVATGTPDFLKFQITEDLLKEIQFRLVLLYKSSSVKLLPWQLDLIKGIQPASEYNIPEKIEAIAQVLTLPYVSQIAIDALLVKLMEFKTK